MAYIMTYILIGNFVGRAKLETNDILCCWWHIINNNVARQGNVQKKLLAVSTVRSDNNNMIVKCIVNLIDYMQHSASYLSCGYTTVSFQQQVVLVSK